MKSIISMSFGIALLISQVFGAAVDILEGAIGEAEATASFFEREINSVVAKIEEAVASFKLTFEGSNLTIEGSKRTINTYQQASALKVLKSNVEALADLVPLLVENKFQIEKLRIMLDAMPKNSDDENVAD